MKTKFALDRVKKFMFLFCCITYVSPIVIPLEIIYIAYYPHFENTQKQQLYRKFFNLLIENAVYYITQQIHDIIKL